MRTCPTCASEWTAGEAFCPFDGARLVETPSRVPDPPDPRVGTLLDGRYRIDALLGSGGMGFIYRAHHLKLDIDVAIKVLRDSEAANAEIVERFRREAESATRIGHPGIVRVLDFGIEPRGAQYMVMELLEGEDVSQRLARLGPFAPDHAVKLLLEACEALAAAHHAGIVHRDLKPENLYLARLPDGRERLKVVDFGLAKMSDAERPGVRGAKLTKTGTVFGTPKYIAPEQALGKGADARSDVYSLGCIAYEMLTGVAPFDGENYLGIVNQHLFDPPPPFAQANPRVSVSHGLENVVMQALAKKPEERIASMEHFAYALSHATGLGHASTMPGRAPSSPPSASSGFPQAGSLPPGSTSMRPSSRPLRLEEADAVGASIPPPRRARWLLPMIVLVASALAAIGYLVLRGR